MKRVEVLIFAIILTAANLPLLWNGFSDGLIYFPEKALAGQWWRFLTHPFAHVSIYHLLLDGIAFLLLYAQLVERSIVKRLGSLLGIHSAIVLAVTFGPSAQATGYCGLSGLAHGLMAIWCLERIAGLNTRSAEKIEQRIAFVVFTGLVAKCVYEVTAGHAFLASTHLGDVGVPVVISHLAGVIGAVITYGLLNFSRCISYWSFIKNQITLNVGESK